MLGMLGVTEHPYPRETPSPRRERVRVFAAAYRLHREPGPGPSRAVCARVCGPGPSRAVCAHVCGPGPWALDPADLRALPRPSAAGAAPAAESILFPPWTSCSKPS